MENFIFQDNIQPFRPFSHIEGMYCGCGMCPPEMPPMHPYQDMNDMMVPMMKRIYAYPHMQQPQMVCGCSMCNPTPKIYPMMPFNVQKTKMLYPMEDYQCGMCEASPMMMGPMMDKQMMYPPQQHAQMKHKDDNVLDFLMPSGPSELYYDED